MTLLLLLACTSPPLVPDTGDSDVSDSGADTETPPDDTEPPPDGTDDDGDGWTVEAGDCDDADVWVNPGWDERTHDDLDNDCDGRVDEAFAGVLALQYRDGVQEGRVHLVDPLGDVDRTWTVPVPATRAMAERRDRAGWWILDPAGRLLSLDPQGVLTEVWTIEELDEPPASLWGLAVHPDGSVYTSAVDRLIRVASGDGEVVASWRVEAESGHDVAATALAVDQLTGEVVLFGFYGGVATWSAEGLAVRVPEDPLAPSGSFACARADERGAIYALGLQGAEWGIWRWDGALSLAGAWKDSTGEAVDFVPASFDVDPERGDFYVTANGGWFRTIWRVFGDDGHASLLYPDAAVLETVPPPEDADRFFGATAVRWSTD